MATSTRRGMVFAVSARLILLGDLWRLLTGQIDDEHLMLIQESEEAAHAGSRRQPAKKSEA